MLKTGARTRSSIWLLSNSKHANTLQVAQFKVGDMSIRYPESHGRPIIFEAQLYRITTEYCRFFPKSTDS